MTQPNVQVLTVKGVRRAALKYYRARKLTAQHPDFRRRQCVFHLGVYRCVIGAALNRRTLVSVDEADTGEGVTSLIDAGIIRVVGQNQIAKLVKIQLVYDQWVRLSSELRAATEIARSRKRFLALIAPTGSKKKGG